MQAFRSECVRERIVRDPASAPFLQRKHYQLLRSGHASKAPWKAQGEEEEVCVPTALRKRMRELREEGGEPAE